MLRLMGQQLPWRSNADDGHLREFVDPTIHSVEEIDAVRERVVVIHEDISTRLAECMNRTMYALTIVAVPGVEDPWSFVWIVGMIAAIAGAELLMLCWMRLIGGGPSNLKPIASLTRRIQTTGAWLMARVTGL